MRGFSDLKNAARTWRPTQGEWSSLTEPPLSQVEQVLVRVLVATIVKDLQGEQKKHSA